MLPELDWDDTERTLVRDESAPAPVPAQRTIPLAEREVPKAEPSWKKSTVRIVEAAPSTEQVPAVWDDDTENTDFERIVDEAPPSDRRALESVFGKNKGNKTQPIAKRDSIPKRDPNKTKPMRLPIDEKVPDPAPTQPVAVHPDDLDQEDYETIAFERDNKTGELRPVETGVRLKRAGQALDLRRTVVGMAPPSHLLDAIEQAERRIAERRARAAELARQAKELAKEKPRPKAMSVDDSVHVLPVIHVATPPPEPPQFEPKVIVPDTQAMTAWQPPQVVSPFAVSPSAVPASEPSPATLPAISSYPPAISSHPPAISSYPPAISSPPPAISSYPPPVAGYPSSYPPPAEQLPTQPPARNWETVQRRFPVEPDFISTAERIQRRSRFRSLVAAFVCLLFVFAGVVAGALLLREGDGAVVRIHVQSQSGADLPLANIYLNGNKSCEATPCVLRNLEPGTHRVRVEAPGHAPTEQTISVDKGQDRMLAITVNRHAG